MDAQYPAENDAETAPRSKLFRTVPNSPIEGSQVEVRAKEKLWPSLCLKRKKGSAEISTEPE